MRKILILVFLVFFFSIPITAQIIHVPTDQPTIQAGINAAVNGDVVLVDEGIYYENINFMGKAITVASRYYLDNKERHICKTIINGSRPGNPDFGSVVSFVSGEDTNSVLCGLTITGGTGTKLIMPLTPEMRIGGGVLCFASSAKIINNIFKENIIGGSPLCFGAGIVTGPPGFPVPILIENNDFIKNEVYGIINADGGGLTNYFPGRICNNKFYNNYVFCEQGIASGGGMTASSVRDASAQLILVSGNLVNQNKTESNTNGPIGAIAGGMEIYGYNIVVTKNIVTGNEVCSSNNYSYGAGIVLDYPTDNVFLKNNLISHNKYGGAGGCLGGGVCVAYGDAQLFNNVISHNKATQGAGIYTTIENSVNRPIFINNTIVKNIAAESGGGIYNDRSESTLMNSILWNNSAPSGPQIFVNGGSIDVSYSNIKGGWEGTGNLAVNPQLLSNFCLLNHNSQCIDAGNPDPMYYDPENPLEIGLAQSPSLGTVRNDMGAYGGTNSVNLREYLIKPLVEEKGSTAVTNKSGKNRSSNYPNPFNPTTTIQYSIPGDINMKTVNVKLVIYDILGREIAILVNEEKSPGEYEIKWNAVNQPSGIYIYRIITGSYSETKKIMLVR